MSDISAIATPLAAGTANARFLRWNMMENALWWIDTGEERLLACDADGKCLAERLLPPSPLTVMPSASGRVLLGVPKRLFLTEIASTTRLAPPAPRVLAAVDALEERTAIGNGRTDRRGAFVFGTTNTSGSDRKIGSFYQFSPQQGLRRLALPTVVAASCVCFNLNGTRLYLADATASSLLTCRYDSENATVHDVHPFAQSRCPGWSMQDAFVDRHDGLWVAQRSRDGGSAIVQYDVHGSIHRVVTLPMQIESLAAGGKDLAQLFILDTTGQVSIVEGVEVAGTPEVPFDDSGYQHASQRRLLNPQPPGKTAAMQDYNDDHDSKSKN